MNEEIILEKFAERFTQLIKNSSIEIPVLAQRLGIKSKSTIYRYMNAEMAPKIPTVKYASEIFNVNPLWLMGYDVPMERNFDKNIQGAEKKSEGSAVVLIYGSIPAGTPMECIEDIVDTEEIPIDMLKGGKQYFGLRVKGNSMFPEYLDNDNLIILKQNDCESGDDCIVMVNGSDGTFKRVIKNENGIILQPLNPEYQPIIYTNEQIEQLPVRIIGKVVELRRRK